MHCLEEGLQGHEAHVAVSSAVVQGTVTWMVLGGQHEGRHGLPGKALATAHLPAPWAPPRVGRSRVSSGDPPPSSGSEPWAGRAHFPSESMSGGRVSPCLGGGRVLDRL